MKYQGREFTSTLQAPNKGELNSLVSSARKFARTHHMENFKILESGKDPDGGYRAIVTAHNWNPINWIKEKIKGKKKEEEKGEKPLQLPSPGETSSEREESTEEPAREVPPTRGGPQTGDDKAWKELYEQAQKDATASGTTERHYQEAARKSDRVASHWRQFGDEKGPGETFAEYDERMKGSPRAGRATGARRRPELTEEELAKLSWKQRRRYRRTQKGIEESQKAADIEIYTQGVPSELTQYYKTLQKEFYTDKATGATVPEPRTAEERAKADYHASQWVYLPVKKELSPPEQLAIARTMEAEGMEMTMIRGKYADWKRDRSFTGRAAKTVAGGLGAIAGIGQVAMGAATMGVAGMARSTQGSSRGRERATRMHAPGVPMDLYGVRPMLGVGIPSSRVHSSAGLGHLRALTMPGIRRPRTQVRQTVRRVGEEY